PVKTGQALYQAATAGLIGVSYAPGEMPLVPGNTYYVEMTPAPDSAAFAAYKFRHQSQNGYPHGDAYWNGLPQSNVDLEMTIMEYEPWYAPAIVNPSFEDYGGQLDGWQIDVFDGKGPDDPPHSDGAYGVDLPDDGHFAGKITCWQSLDFQFGQIVEVGEVAPGSTEVGWAVTTEVHLHSRHDTTQYPQNVHQMWEIGWNDDGS
ncbi:MAG: hypothetical protein GY778_22095, partial [bacterium]|nr:hypothetical protein [bacterium]